MEVFWTTVVFAFVGGVLGIVAFALATRS